MAVLLKTNVGDLIINLFDEQSPILCRNFIGLCKLKYFNNRLFFNLLSDFTIQFGANEANNEISQCFWSFFNRPTLVKTDSVNIFGDFGKKGSIAFTNKNNYVGSTCCILLNDIKDKDMSNFSIFAEITNLELVDTLNSIPSEYNTNKPLSNVRIWDSIVLNDPFLESRDEYHIEENLIETKINNSNLTSVDIEADLFSHQKLKLRKISETFLDDLGFQHTVLKSPENVIFIANLNPFTQEFDLEIIFEQFGEIVNVSILKNSEGFSRCFGFIEFVNKKSAQLAIEKMNDVIIDDRRIYVAVSNSQSRYRLDDGSIMNFNKKSRSWEHWDAAFTKKKPPVL
eukprot:TRINITY_DN12042_c0_g1_i1.p1 TRINITY_DN12042_c0_g1~~TRINITY_DN12042_c0_g1_i1.p1  ORF type:complete len:341 (+),score=106.27 TRINITY_DN12042_c0_g1_i1:30-1052(+)